VARPQRPATAKAACDLTFVRATVRRHEYPDGRIAVFLVLHRLGDYDVEGPVIGDTPIAE
jgi:hypothetical protein